MRVLLIADPVSVWTARYVDQVLGPRGVHVVLTSRCLSAQMRDSPFKKLYADQGVALVHDDPVRLTARIPKLRVIINSLSLLIRLLANGPFDAVHVHYVTPWAAKLGSLIRPFSRRFIMSFWGSDLLRASKNELQLLRPLVRNADVVTYGNLSMGAELKLLAGSHGPSLRLIHFGVAGLDAIDRLCEAGDRHLSRQKFGLPADRSVVVVGYNDRRAQQHLAVIEVLSALPSDTLESTHFVFPMTYNVESDSYLTGVMSRVAETFPHATCLTDYLDLTDQAHLARSADVFINAQTTDMFSASMQEFLYAGAVMVKGDWLTYPDLDAMGVEYVTFREFSDLGRVVADVLQRKEALQALFLANSRVLRHYCTWSAVERSWFSLYTRDEDWQFTF